MGETERSRNHLGAARTLSLEAKNDLELAHVELNRFGLFSGVDSLESDAACLPELRRLIAKSGQPHLMIELRLCVARCEARRHSPNEAKKHLRLAARMLSSYPNVWLAGVLRLDESNVEALLGNLDRSLLCAQEAMDWAEQSAHYRTRMAAAVNISHLLCSLGRSEEAKQFLNYVPEGPDTNVHIRLAALDCWANQLINSGSLEECRGVLEEVRGLAKQTAGKRLHWDSLTELFSLARLEQEEGKWSEEARYLKTGVDLAEQSGDHLWDRRMRLAQGKCLAKLGQFAEAMQVLLGAVNGEFIHPQEMARYFGALAAMDGTPQQQGAYLERAIRLAAGMSDVTLEHDLAVGVSAGAGVASIGTAPSLPDLDTAVALLELGGHPHILAREALAVARRRRLRHARVALVARTPDGPRVDRGHGLGRTTGALAAAAQAGPVRRHRRSANIATSPGSSSSSPGPSSNIAAP